MTISAKNKLRNKKILLMYGEKSFQLIADKLGVTRNVVAGVIWRENWPIKNRIKSNSKSFCGNKCGTGRHGPGEHAPETLRGGA